MSRSARNDGDVMLALSGISKSFGSVTALDDVSLTLRRGTVHALVGENGAGKTTLMRVAFRLVHEDRGTVSVPLATQSVRTPADAIAAGIGMVHQHFTNVPAMTVAENVALGGHGRFDLTQASARVTSVGARAGLSLDPNARVGDLPVGAQQRLEIIKALAHDARLLILDEPTAVLAPREAEELLAWLRAFANDGNGVVLITHKLREALAIADDVTVLRRGRVVLSTAAADLTPEELASVLIGDEAEITPHSPLHTSTAGEVVARLESVVVRNQRAVALRDANLEVHAGEIIGVAAVEGAGQHELLRLLGGRARPSSGRVMLPVSIGFIAEDRHRDALVLDFSIPENVALKGAGARRGRMRWREIDERARTLVQAFDVRGGTAARRARDLSGGNQQKLVLARELDDSPRLVVAENPTRGLDIRASAAVWQRLRNAAAEGAGVVVYSSDLDEVLSLATRIVVVHAGRLVETTFDRDAVGRAMLGVA